MSALLHERHLERHEIDDLSELERLLGSGESLSDYVVHALDLTGFDGWGESELDGTIFLGCVFGSIEERLRVERLGAYIFPRFEGLPYETHRTTLYTVEELMRGYEDGGYVGTLDFKIFEHFDRARRRSCGVPIRETLAQRIHDHAIDDALLDVIEANKGRGIVGVMGGHSTKRTDPYFRKVAHMTWELTRRGYFVASGGGPGIMEAANLGAWFANWGNPKVLDAALEMLKVAPKFDGGQAEGTLEYLDAIKAFMAVAREVTERFGPGASEEDVRRFGREAPEPGKSLAVPTWFYGHEPSNLFSTFIAKYFANSIREDGLLAISLGGVVYAPGSAGTLQEVFMDLAQNHYATFDFYSPMVFLGAQRFGTVHALIREFIANRGMDEVYGDMVTMLDDPMDAVDFIEAHPARERVSKTPLYALVES